MRRRWNTFTRDWNIRTTHFYHISGDEYAVGYFDQNGFFNQYVYMWGGLRFTRKGN